MPGFLLTVASPVACTHGMGKATTSSPNPRVIVMAQPSVLITAPYVIASCTNPPVSGGQCVSGKFLAGTTRVLSNMQPLAIAMLPSPSLCAPTPAPMLTPPSQTRVFAM
jgi:hypothetical protein